jgi:ceramide glucosyltransferase
MSPFVLGWLSWLTVATTFTLIALVRSLAARGDQKRTQVNRSGVLLLRPVDAATPEELENLSHPLAGVEQLVLAPFRPRLPNTVRWLPSDPLQHNRKLGHLQYALSILETTGRTVLVVDADVRVDEALVDTLLAELDAGADLAWAAPRPLEPGLPRGLLVQSLHSFHALNAISDGAKPVCGKAIALSPQGLEVLRALPDCLGEDLELARKLHQQHLKVALAGEAQVPGATASLHALLARFTRWMQVLKAHRPLLFPSIPLLFAATPVLAVGAAVNGSPVLLSGALVLVLARATLAAVLERKPRTFTAWFGAELLLLCCWFNALVLGSKVTWRGRVMEVGLHGRLRRSEP